MIRIVKSQFKYMHTELFCDLNPNDLVVTVNKRLANALRESYNQYQLTSSQPITWQSPDILPITSWLQRCWQELTSVNDSQQPLLLLNNIQEQVLWQQIIRNSSASNPLLQIEATAQAAQQAWQLCQQWNINYRDSIFTYTEDSKTWQSWAAQFEKLCNDNQWLDLSTLPYQLINAFQAKTITLPKRIFLVGFDEINPQQTKLFEILRQQGCKILDINHLHETSHAQQLALINTEAEIKSMAQWSYQLWQQGIKQIGCVIPNLTTIRSKVITIFNEVFSEKIHATPFNISAGLNLKEYPIIYTALSTLGFNYFCETTQASFLLRSPFLAYAEQEMTQRAQLDATLRAEMEPWLNLQQIIVAAKKNHCPQLAKLLQAFNLTLENKVNHLFPQQWALYFSQQLAALGWPGERTLSSEEFQLTAAWSTLLNEFSKLDLILGKIDKKTALQYLNQLAANTIFQPQTTTEISIQILGILETAGLNFEYLWVMGLDDVSWPPAAKPNPFIPYSLQRKLGLPHASSQRELHFAQLNTKRLLHSANNVIFSYPQQQDDKALRPSNLIQAIQKTDLQQLNLAACASIAEKIFATKEIETYQDEYAPSIAANEKLHGGTSIFKQQAACPFQAFAHFRLEASNVELPQRGLSAQERGQLIHQALEIVWNLIGDQQTLLQYSDKQLQTIIANAVDLTLVEFTKRRPLTFKPHFSQLEKIRLQKLLSQWLELEKTRPPFKVSAIERATQYTLANIPMKLRVDRIDQLQNGTYLIIDYKTGEIKPQKEWFGPRPDAPQLPIYFLASPQNIQSLALAQIRSNKIQFKGISAEETNIEGIIPLANNKDETIPTDWHALSDYWRNVLENLAQQFQQGYARVDPKSPDTCQYCDLHTFCRIKELKAIYE